MANDLTDPKNPTKSMTPWSGQALPSNVISALDGPDSIFDLPLPSQKIVDQLVEWIPLAEQSLVGCPIDEINRMLTKLKTALPMRKTSDAEAEQMLSIYRESLADLPRDILSTAMLRCAQTSMFFPTIAEIRKQAGPELSHRRYRLMRAKSLADRPTLAPPTDLVDPERVSTWLKAFRAKTGAAE